VASISSSTDAPSVDLSISITVAALVPGLIGCGVRSFGTLFAGLPVPRRVRGLDWCLAEPAALADDCFVGLGRSVEPRFLAAGAGRGSD
jgi:hypothetical protein